MMFAQMLRCAEAAGVKVLAYDTAWQLPQGVARWGKRLPLVYGDAVHTRVDEEHLQRVLLFNSTDSRTHRKSPAKAAQKGRGGSGCSM